MIRKVCWEVCRVGKVGVIETVKEDGCRFEVGDLAEIREVFVGMKRVMRVRRIFSSVSGLLSQWVEDQGSRKYWFAR